MRRHGFSMAETIVVMAIIVLLAALIFPAIMRVRGAYDAMLCKNNLRQIGISLRLYQDDYGSFPPGHNQNVSQSDPRRVVGWMALVLPYHEYDNLYSDIVRACKLTNNPLLPPHHANYERIIRLYACPSDSRLLEPMINSFGIRSSYSGYLGIGGVSIEGGIYLPGVF